MKHTDYIELTRAFEYLTNEANTLRLLFSKVEAPADPSTLETGGPNTRWVPTDQARQHPLFPKRMLLLDSIEQAVEDTARLMEQCVNDWTHENQGRADQGLPPTADTRELFQAMDGFMSVTETPTRGIAGLYTKVRSRCRAWLDQATEWFPELWPEHIRKLLDSPDYKKAVKFEQITPPFTWNGTIKELAEWLDDSMLVARPKVDTITERTHDWALYDGVFLKKGRPITAKQLQEAFKH